MPQLRIGRERDMEQLLTAVSENTWSGAADPDYRGFGSQFGGWTAAALLRAIMLEPAANGAPLSQSVLFIEAIHDGPFEISTRLIRSGAHAPEAAPAACG